MMRPVRNSIGPSLATVLCALLVACGTPAPPTEQGGGAVLTEPKPKAMWATGWLEFADLSLHGDDETEPPTEPYLRGRILGGLFQPTGGVSGIMSEPPPRRIVTRGWLELRSRAFFPENSKRERIPPFVEGYQDAETGGFYPTSDVQEELFASEGDDLFSEG
jgi:hypothetical protein